MIAVVARCTAFALALLAPLLIGADCGGIGCPATPPPMSPARAKEIDPTVDTGLAVSTTHVYGDCRPGEPSAPSSLCGGGGACARERWPMRVLVVPINVSIPIAPDCAPAFAVEDAVGSAAFDGVASEEGELVVALDSGRYTILISTDDRCAFCGLTEEGGACTADVSQGRITVRELVLDRATH